MMDHSDNEFKNWQIELYTHMGNDSIDRILIYYLSGTGNTRRVAEWIREESEFRGFKTDSAAIEYAFPAKQLAADPRITLGIGMPTHGFTIPWMMLRFLMHLPSGKKRRAFVFATRAGAKYGPIPGYPPGIAGSSIFIAALVLWMKGYRVRWMKSINMPSNWLSLHSGLRTDIVQTIILKARRQVFAFTKSIVHGKRVLANGNTAWEFTWGILLSWISVAYLFLGRFFLAKLFFANNSCNGCGLCERHCPTASIDMLGVKDPRPYWSFTCESCMRCMAYCPANAIEAGHSWGVILYFIVTAPLSLYLVNMLRGIIPGMGEYMATSLSYGVYLLQYFLSLFICYWVFILITRIPVLNALFTYTTLTHYYRRYHEPGTGIYKLPGRIR